MNRESKIVVGMLMAALLMAGFFGGRLYEANHFREFAKAGTTGILLDTWHVTHQLRLDVTTSVTEPQAIVDLFPQGDVEIRSLPGRQGITATNWVGHSGSKEYSMACVVSTIPEPAEWTAAYYAVATVNTREVGHIFAK